MREPRFSDLCADAKADRATALLDGGQLWVLGGRKPASADEQVSEQPLLAVLRFGAPAFEASYGGVARACPIRPDTRARASGAPTWFRAVTAGGYPVFDGTVGPAYRPEVAGGYGERYDLELDGEVEEGGEVRVDRLTYAESKG